MQIINQGNCRFSKLAGPLGAQEKGWYPDMPFLLSCMVAVDVFGHFVRQEKHLDVLAKLPTLIVQTEIDDSADHTVGVTVIKEIEDRTGTLSFILPTIFHRRSSRCSPCAPMLMIRILTIRACRQRWTPPLFHIICSNRRCTAPYGASTRGTNNI